MVLKESELRPGLIAFGNLLTVVDVSDFHRSFRPFLTAVSPRSDHDPTIAIGILLVDRAVGVDDSVQILLVIPATNYQDRTFDASKVLQRVSVLAVLVKL